MFPSLPIPNRIIGNAEHVAARFSSVESYCGKSLDVWAARGEIIAGFLSPEAGYGIAICPEWTSEGKRPKCNIAGYIAPEERKEGSRWLVKASDGKAEDVQATALDAWLSLLRILEVQPSFLSHRARPALSWSARRSDATSIGNEIADFYRTIESLAGRDDTTWFAGPHGGLFQEKPMGAYGRITRRLCKIRETGCIHTPHVRGEYSEKFDLHLGDFHGYVKRHDKEKWLACCPESRNTPGFIARYTNAEEAFSGLVAGLGETYTAGLSGHEKMKLGTAWLEELEEWKNLGDLRKLFIPVP